MTPDLMEEGSKTLLRAMNTPTNAGESGGREANYGRVVNDPDQVDLTHGSILYLDDIEVSFDGFKALNKLSLNIAVGDPLFVVRIDADKRQVIVGPREALLTASLTLKEGSWLGGQDSLEAAAQDGQPVLARVRSTREPVAGRLAVRDGEVSVVFDGAEEGVAPGQACVLYDPADPDRVLGGGFIAGTVRRMDLAET